MYGSCQNLQSGDHVWVDELKTFFLNFSVPGLYSPAEMMDFGIIRTLDDPVTVSLNLVNTGYKPVHISVRQLASFIGSMEILASTFFSGIKTCNIP